MSNLPVKHNAYAVQNFAHQNISMMPSMEEMRDLISLSRTLADTPFYAKLGPGGVLAIWLTARELRLPPMMCLNGGLHNIEGKVQMSAQLMNMMIINAGHEVKVIYSNNKGCKLKFTRNYRDGRKPDVNEFEYNESDANEAQVFGVRGQQPGVWEVKPKTNWIKFPRAMYYARCMSGGGKMFMSDVLMSVYALDEIYEVDEKYIESEASYVEGEVSKNNVSINHEPVKPEIKEPVPVEIKPEDISKFKDKFGIGKQSPHEKYLDAISDRCKKSHEEMITIACMNEKGFIESFDKWKAKLDQKTNQQTELEKTAET